MEHCLSSLTQTAVELTAAGLTEQDLQKTGPSQHPATEVGEAHEAHSCPMINRQLIVAGGWGGVKRLSLVA